jgi:hypothetical protein
VPLDREMGQELFHLADAHRRGVPPVGPAVEADELFDPKEVTAFGGEGVMLDAEDAADLFEELHGEPSWCDSVVGH